MAKSSGPTKDDVKNNVAGWDLVGFESGGSSGSSSSKGGSSGSSSGKGGSSGSSGGSDSGSSYSPAYDKRTGVDYSRNQSLAGQVVRQGMYDVYYDDMGYAGKSVKVSDSPGYVVDGVTYGGDGNILSGEPRYWNSGGSGGGAVSGSGGSGTSGGIAVADFSQYLKDLYAANTEKQLAALKNAYDQNTAALNAQGAEIPKTYYAAKNETAAQSALAKQQFNEYAATRGLNTGTSGQAALANSAALQGNLADIGASEAKALSDHSLARTQLESQYQNAISQAQAEGDTQLAQALYQEYVRQADAAAAAQAAAQAQNNWEAQFNASNSQWQQQFDTSKSQWQQQFDTSGSRWQQEISSNQESENRKYAYNLAATMLAAGVMPDASTLAAAGISSADALQMRMAALSAARTGTTTTAKVNTQAKTKEASGMSLSTAKEAAKNGVFSDDVVKVLRANGYSDTMLKAIYGYDPDAGNGSSNVYVNGKGYVSAEQAEKWLNNNSIIQIGYDTNGNPTYTVLNTEGE